MKEAPLLSGPIGRVCILDVETAPDPLCTALAGKRGSSSEITSALHRLTDASTLSATERADGTWADFELSSVAGCDTGEEEIIRQIDRRLQKLAAASGSIVTYNGVTHDMVAIRRRAARHLMFDLPGIFPNKEPRHIDLMRVVPTYGSGRWGKLRDVAAGLGIPVDHQLRGNGIGSASAGVRKSQVDVSATFLLMLFELAASRRLPDPVILGWRALGHYIAGMGPHGDHLAQFRRHPLGGALEPR